MRRSGETAFAIFTVAIVVPYFTLETWHYFAYVGFGNYVLGYAVDLIAMALMLLGGVTSWRLRKRGGSAAGWLAAAWGFTACLNYRAFAWRYETYQETGAVTGEPATFLYILGAVLCLSFGALIYALYLTRPE